MNDFLKNERGSVARWIILIIIAAAGVYGYQYFKKTPRYALIQVKKAIVFSNAETAQKFMDIERVAERLPESVTHNQSTEAVTKRLIHEIDSPHEKSFFSNVKSWSVIRVPIAIGADEITASAETTENTTVNLEKTAEGYWIITSIETR